MFGVGLRGLSGVVLGMLRMAVCRHGMVRSLFSGSGFVVFGRFAMMVCGRLVMLGSSLMVFCDFRCGGSHRIFLLDVSAWKASSAALEVGRQLRLINN
jgi:hypothetical protein